MLLHKLHSMDDLTMAIIFINACLLRLTARVKDTSIRWAWTLLNILLQWCLFQGGGSAPLSKILGGLWPLSPWVPTLVVVSSWRMPSGWNVMYRFVTAIHNAQHNVLLRVYSNEPETYCCMFPSPSWSRWQDMIYKATIFYRDIWSTVIGKGGTSGAP